MIEYLVFLQIPDIRSGDDVIDAVVVDEEAIGCEGHGRGAKILYGKGALDRYLSEHKKKSSEVYIIWDAVNCSMISSSFSLYL